MSHEKVLCLFQDKDLKQYMDDCGNIMSMHNVKVCFTCNFKPYLKHSTTRLYCPSKYTSLISNFSLGIFRLLPSKYTGSASVYTIAFKNQILCGAALFQRTFKLLTFSFTKIHSFRCRMGILSIFWIKNI